MVAEQNHSGTPRDLTTSKLNVVPVADDQWGILPRTERATELVAVKEAGGYVRIRREARPGGGRGPQREIVKGHDHAGRLIPLAELWSSGVRLLEAAEVS